MWTTIFDWTVIGIIVPTLVGIGVGVMSVSPPAFLVAKACFWLSAILLLSKLGDWLVGINWSVTQRLSFTFAAFAFIGIGLVESLRWIYGKELKLQEIISINHQKILRPESLQGKKTVNEIEWDFSSFLGGGVYGEYGIRIGGFQASAVNHTGRTLRDVHGYIESLITGKTFEMYLNINGLPVRSEDTHGIPNGARFLAGC